MNVLRNLAHLRDDIMPGLAKHASNCLAEDVKPQLQTLRQTVDRLEHGLITEFVARKMPPLLASLRYGLLESGMDWVNAPMPKGKYPFIYG